MDRRKSHHSPDWVDIEKDTLLKVLHVTLEKIPRHARAARKQVEYKKPE